MADYQQRDNSGSLFKNSRKEKDTHPDYTGKVMVDGSEYWISAWLKTSERTGTRFMSLAFRPMDQAAPVTARDEEPRKAKAKDKAPELAYADDFGDDDIPF